MEETLYTPVMAWEKKWVNPAPTAISATLGSRPGNTLRPPANDYQVYKWTTNKRTVVNPNAPSPEITIVDPKVYFQIKEEDDVIAGIPIAELTKETSMDVDQPPKVVKPQSPAKKA